MTVRGIVRRRIATSLAMTLLVAGTATAPARADVSRAGAAKKAMAALGSERRGEPVAVFGDRAPVRAGARVTAPPAGPPAPAAQDGRLTRSRPVAVLTAARPSWLFYEDQAPYRSFQHPGRVALVDKRTGAVRLSPVLRWPPLVNGQLPVYLRSAAGYASARYRVLTVPYPAKPEAVSTGAAATREDRQALADALAAEHACVLRTSDTLGNFYDAEAVDRSRLAFGNYFRSLARLNPGFKTAVYYARRTGGPSPLGFFGTQLRADGCRTAVIYLAGGGYMGQDPPVVSLGVRAVRSTARIDRQDLGATQMAALAAANPGVSFAFVLDAPWTAQALQALRRQPNIVLAQSAGEDALSYLPPSALAGPARSGAENPRRLLDFTNRLLVGLDRASADPAGVLGRAACAGGVLPALAARAFALSGGVGFQDDLLTGTQAVQDAAACDFPALAPAANRAPVAPGASASTPEETPVAVTLPASDPDGDPLSFEVVDAPAGGALSGTGDRRTYTPATDVVGPDRFTYRVSDGRGGTAVGTIAITVTPVADAPVLGGAGTTARFTEDGPAVAVAPGLTVADPDSPALVGATVRLSGGLAAAEDVLALPSTPGLTASYDAASGRLSITGTASLAAYQAALRTVTYATTSQSPSTGRRTVTVQVDDGENLSAPVSASVAVVAVDDAPVLAAGAAPASGFVEDGPAVAVAPDASVRDVDDAVQTLTVAFTAGQEQTDVLDPGTLPAGITIARSATGITYAGPAGPAAFTQALRQLTFSSSSQRPSEAVRTLRISATDAAGTAAATVTRTVTVDEVPDAPTLAATSTPLTYTEDGAPLALLADADVADVDSPQFTSATVTLSSGYHASEDVLSAQVAASLTVSVGGGTLTVSGPGTEAQYEAALRSVTYRNASQDPTPGARELTATVTAEGQTSAPVTRALAVAAVNDPPVATEDSAELVQPEGQTAYDALFPALALSDADNTRLASATVVVPAGFSLGTLPTIGGMLPATRVDADGSTVLAWTVTATVSEYQTGLRAVTVRPAADDNPSGAARTATVTVGDGTASSAAADRALRIDPVDDSPRVTTATDTLTYQEGDGTVPAFGTPAQISVSDPDTPTFSSATVTLSGFDSGQDFLAVDTSGTGLNAVVSPGLVRISGAGTAAQYEHVIESVTYFNPSQNPSSSPRTLAVQVTAGAGAGSSQRQLEVVPVPDAPSTTIDGAQLDYTEGSAAVAIAPNATVSDADSSSLDRATVTITGPGAEATDLLTYGGPIASTYDAASQTLTFTGTASVRDYADALRSVTYRTTSDAPNPGARTISVTVRDVSGLTSAPASRAVRVIPVNSAPTVSLSPVSGTYTEDQGVLTGFLDATLTDADDQQLQYVDVSLGASYVQDQDVLTFTGVPAGISRTSPASGTIRLVGPASKADFATALAGLGYTNGSQDPDTRTRTFSITASDGKGTSDAATFALAVTAVDDPPQVAAGTGPSSYTAGDAPLAPFPAATVSDVDSPTVTTLRVAFSGTQRDADLLSSSTSGPFAAGTYDAATGVLSIAGTGTPAQAAAALATVRFQNTSTTPSRAQRTIQATVSDGALTSAPAVRQVDVTAVNSDPVVTENSGTLQLTEQGNDALAFPALAITDDGTTLSGAAAYLPPGIVATAPAGPLKPPVITTQDGLTEVRYSEIASVADYIETLRGLRVRSVDDNPDRSQRAMAVNVTDVDGASGGAARLLLVTAVNDAPVVTVAPTSALAYTAGGKPVELFADVTATDPDDTQLMSATVRSVGTPRAGDTLALTGLPTGSPITVSTAANGDLTLSGAASLAEYEAALEDVTFANSSQNPPEGTRTFAVQVTDAGFTGAPETSAVASRDVTVSSPAAGS